MMKLIGNYGTCWLKDLNFNFKNGIKNYLFFFDFFFKERYESQIRFNKVAMPCDMNCLKQLYQRPIAMEGCTQGVLII